MGQHGSHISEMIFEDCRVPAANLIGDTEGSGFKCAMDGINVARMHVAATCVGQAQRLIDEALAYAPERSQFGKPIAEFQAIQIMLADSRAEMLAARAMTLETARRIDCGRAAARRYVLLQVFRQRDGLPRRRPRGADPGRRRLRHGA